MTQGDCKSTGDNQVAAPCRRPAVSGYTLIELSIVLVIIGLIIGGISIGTSLYHNAQLIKFITDEKRYADAVQLFKEKYHELPGDMPNATDYWGVNNPNCGSSSDFSTCAGTSNGNGDGRITGSETYLVWNQLALAGLIAGKFAGAQVNGTYGLCTWPAVEANLPATALSQVWPLILYEGIPSGGAYDGNGFYTSGDAGHVMVFGTPIIEGVGCLYNYCPSMLTADAFAIDTKLDDGNPSTGRVQTVAFGSAMPYWNITSTSCVNYSNIADHSTYTYNLSNTNQAGCALVFTKVF